MAISTPQRAAAPVATVSRAAEEARPMASGPELDEDAQGPEDLLDTALEGDFQTDVAVHEPRFSS